jgi:hypothetical protein
MATRKRITRAFTASGGDGWIAAAWTPFSLARCRGFIRMISSIPRSSTTTCAKKGGDNLGFSGRKRVKGDKVVAFCDRHCNVIAPFVAAPGDRNESPLLREALPEVMHIVREVGLDLQGTIVSLDGVYDCRANRKAIFNRGMVPNINPNPRGRKQLKRGRKPIFELAIFKERFRTIERVFAWEDKFRRLLLRFERISGPLCVQDARLRDDQSPALLPDLIRDRCASLGESHSEASRRDPACPSNAQKPPEMA